ncbi:MAG TPA: hypothetical protein PKC80_02255 [Burkholderiaceae bacterium]|nr:hypothetical protein [Burkholderiaceae bacterium]
MTHNFRQRYHGCFQGMLQWQQLDDLWVVVRAQSNGWYLLSQAQIENQKQDLPQEPMPAAEFLAQLDDINSHLHSEHQQSFCGIVYADDPLAPTLIKVYDPEGLGSMCRISTKPTVPLYVLTRLQPEPLQISAPTAPARAWWKFW